jgi:hypothetical protein
MDTERPMNTKVQKESFYLLPGSHEMQSPQDFLEEYRQTEQEDSYKSHSNIFGTHAKLRRFYLYV